jgi:hypothetical protein
MSASKFDFVFSPACVFMEPGCARLYPQQLFALIGALITLAAMLKFERPALNFVNTAPEFLQNAHGDSVRISE